MPQPDKPNCDKHLKDVNGISDMDHLAILVGDLHYESLHQLLFSLSNKLFKDSKKDLRGGRGKLALALLSASHNIDDAAGDIEFAWKISQPFMQEPVFKGICQCKYAEVPCQEYCTCKNPMFSHGCKNCLTYKSK